jgi:DNA gyrase/topoisomerase IV subunit B
MVVRERRRARLPAYHLVMASRMTIEAVRQRPGMFVGGADGGGIVQMVLEIVANAYDLYLVGRCTTIAIHIGADGTIEVVDDGPGMVVDERVLTTIGDRPTTDGHRPHVHLGSGGPGLGVVSALCERFEIRTVRDGVETLAVAARGRMLASVVMERTAAPSGTRLRFRPDPDIFGHVRLPRARLTAELEDLSFVSSGLTLRWSVAGDDLASKGIAALVAIGVPCALADVVHHRATCATPSGPIDIEVAVAWRPEPSRHGVGPQVDSFVNLRRSRGGGVHVAALLAGIGAFVGVRPQERSRHGLVAAVSVVLADVLYGNPTRDELVSPDVREPVTATTLAALRAWETAQPAAAAALRQRLG